MRTQITDLRSLKAISWKKGLLALTLACGFCSGVQAQEPACTTIPSGQNFWVRLTQPVSSYSSKPGSLVTAELIASPQCGQNPVFATGVPVEGHITYVRRVGMGIRHGTSAMAIDFEQVVAGSDSISIKAQIEEIANGREGVKHGVIQGVGAKDTPQRLMSTRLLHLPYWEPDDYWIFMVRRAVFPFTPEPEIYLPPGTDLRLELTSPLQIPAAFQSVREEYRDTEEPEVRGKLLALPSRSLTGSGKPSDVVNLAFLGSPQQIEAAFQAAGWTYGDSVSTLSVLREMRAMSSLNSYSHLPISKQWLDGQPPDFRFQKSFDSYAKREHIRLWKEDSQEDGLWAGSAIRETSADWSIRKGKFVHHVDADLDAERDMVVRELSLTGCVAQVYGVERADSFGPLRAASGDPLRTDGGITVVKMQDCDPPAPALTESKNELPSRPQHKITRFFRNQALSIRDLWQSNAIYESVDLSRVVIHSLRDRARQRKAQKEALTAKASAVAAGEP